MHLPLKSFVNFFIFTTLVISLNAQSVEPFISNQAFSYGETLRYKMYYSLFFNIPVAEVEMKVHEKPEYLAGEKHYLISGTGKSYRFYNSFFKVHDIYKSYVSVNTFEPRISVRIINEGNYHSSEYYVYNPRKNYLKNKKGKLFKIPDLTQDILSAIYLARTFDYSHARPGDSFMLNVFIDDSVYYVGVRYAGKENLKMNGRVYHCLKLKPILIVDRVFKSEEDMTLWVSDDKNKIPVYVHSGIAVGSVKAELIEYKNLKNPPAFITEK